MVQIPVCRVIYLHDMKIIFTIDTNHLGKGGKMSDYTNIHVFEEFTENVSMDIGVEKQLYSAESEFQKIEVFQSHEFGRFLMLDADIIFSEADEFVYNEMVTHVPMSVHPNVKKVLIIGGGDGGVARELTAYPEIEQIEVVEPDEQMVEVCREFFPRSLSCLNKCLYSLILFATIAYKDFELTDTFNVCSFCLL